MVKKCLLRNGKNKIFLQGKETDYFAEFDVILLSLILFYPSNEMTNEECIAAISALSFQTPFLVFLTGLKAGALKECWL